MAIIFSSNKADVKNVESTERSLKALNKDVFEPAESKLTGDEVSQLLAKGQRLLATGSVDVIKTVSEEMAVKDKKEIVAKYAGDAPKGPSSKM